MKASTDAPAGQGQDDGWDETVLVWNATVARIPAPAPQPDSARDVAGTRPTRSEAREAPRARSSQARAQRP